MSFIPSLLFGLACTVLPLGLSGCAGQARLISSDNNYAVVAIPNNSNMWPTYHRERADDLMRATFPDGYVIDGQVEAVTGTTQVVQSNTQRSGDPILAALRIAPIKEQTTQTTNFVNKTEHRIYFRRTDAPAQPVPAPTNPAGYVAQEGYPAGPGMPLPYVAPPLDGQQVAPPEGDPPAAEK